jgi:hypothetical protein
MLWRRQSKESSVLHLNSTMTTSLAGESSVRLGCLESCPHICGHRVAQPVVLSQGAGLFHLTLIGSFTLTLVRAHCLTGSITLIIRPANLVALSINFIGCIRFAAGIHSDIRYATVAINLAGVFVSLSQTNNSKQTKHH